MAFLANHNADWFDTTCSEEATACNPGNDTSRPEWPGRTQRAQRPLCKPGGMWLRPQALAPLPAATAAAAAAAPVACGHQLHLGGCHQRLPLSHHQLWGQCHLRCQHHRLSHNQLGHCKWHQRVTLSHQIRGQCNSHQIGRVGGLVNLQLLRGHHCRGIISHYLSATRWRASSCQRQCQKQQLQCQPLHQCQHQCQH